MQDVLFNALLCQADKDLAQIARALGEDGVFFEEGAERTARAMNEKLWDAEHSIYLDFDLVAQRPIYVYVAPNFVHQQGRHRLARLLGLVGLVTAAVVVRVSLLIS